MPKKSSARPEPPEAEYHCKYIRGVPTQSQPAAAGYKVYILIERADEGLRLGTVFWEARRFFDKLLIATPLARWWTIVQSHRFTPICEMMGVQSCRHEAQLQVGESQGRTHTGCMEV